MRSTNHVLCLLVCVLALSYSPANALDHPANQDELHLSEEVQALLRAEMTEISVAIQTLAQSLATGEWASIEETSENIRASYVMKKNLTEAQRQELEQNLPDRFKELDMDFHGRAEKLGSAAAARDPELAAFHYSRLVESCISCHEIYAKTRFPGFSTPKSEAHHH